MRNHKGKIYSVFMTALIFISFNRNHLFDFNIVDYLLLISTLMVFMIFGIKFDKLNFIVNRDPLTNCFNRSYGLKYFERLQKYGKFTLISLDIDNFKLINDQFGHGFGDIALERCAKALNKSLMKGDVLVRWGGDEFIILTKETDVIELVSIKRRIENEIEKLKMDLHRLSANKLHLGVSIGWSFYPQEGKDIEQLLQLSDKRMYSNKNRKKNTRNLSS